LITEQLYEKGLENVQKGNHVLALINFERVAEINPNYKDISSVLATTRKKAEQNRDRAEAQLAANESQSANREANSPSNSNDRETTPGATQRTFEQSLSQRNTQLNMNIDSQLVRNFYEEALDLIQKEEWLQAGVVLEKVKLIEPNYQNTEFLLDQVKQNLTMSSVMNAKGKFAAGSKSRNSGFILFGFLAGAVMLPVGLLLLSPTTRARYYILLKKYDKAREIYEGMLTKKQHNIKLYITLANIYINERRIDEVAIRIFERAIQYNDNLKIQLEPIVNRYYLEKSKTSDNPIHLLDEKLREHLRKMGN
jgi:tetratricopeptide (TPR) repeat protein